MKQYQKPSVLTVMLNNEDVVMASLINYGSWNTDWDEIFKLGGKE